MKKTLATWIGIAISVAALIFIAMSFDLSSTVDALALADPSWLLIATALYVVSFPLRGLRWSILMRAVKPISARSATEVFTIGFMANNILPLRLGDVARALVLARREQIPASATFSNVMLERVFDGLTVAGFLGLVFLLDPPDQAWVGGAGLATGAIFLVAVLVAGVTAWNEERALRLASMALSFLPANIRERLLVVFAKLAKGLATLKNPGATLKVALLSVAIWGGEVFVYLIAQRAFGLQLSYLHLCLVMAVLTFGLMAPSGPGFFGVYEGLVITALGVYGIGEPLAPAFAIAMHAIHFIPGTLLGVVFTWKSGLQLKEIRSASEEKEQTWISRSSERAT
jgi:glycosyltransferase 2 family protein